MSEENVETVRAAIEAINRGDVEGAIELIDPAIKWDLSRRVLNPAVYEGHDGIRRFAAELREIWDEIRVEPVEFIDAGDTVVVSYRIHARGKGSGVDVELPSSSIYTVRHGKIVASRMFREHAEALEAAGLPPSPAASRQIGRIRPWSGRRRWNARPGPAPTEAPAVPLARAGVEVLDVEHTVSHWSPRLGRVSGFPNCAADRAGEGGEAVGEPEAYLPGFGSGCGTLSSLILVSRVVVSKSSE